MHPTIKAALPRVKITANISISFRDGPIGSLDAELLSLYHFMGSSGTIEQFNRGTAVGDIILITIEDLVIGVGLHAPVWEYPIIFIKEYVNKHKNSRHYVVHVTPQLFY